MPTRTTDQTSMHPVMLLCSARCLPRRMCRDGGLTPPYDGSGCRSGESRWPPESPTKLQCIPRCFFAPLDVFHAGCVALVGIAALTPPYDGSGCRSGESRWPPESPTKLQCIPRCIFALLDVFHAGCVAMVGIAALTPPYDGGVGFFLRVKAGFSDGGRWRWVARLRHARLSTTVGARRHIFLYGESGRPVASAIGGAHGCVTRECGCGACGASVRGRCVVRVAGSSAYGVGVASGRCRLRDTLDADQGRVFAAHRQR